MPEVELCPAALPCNVKQRGVQIWTQALPLQAWTSLTNATYCQHNAICGALSCIDKLTRHVQTISTYSFLIFKLAGSNPKSSLSEFFTFLRFIQLNLTHPSLIILIISVRFSFSSCSIFVSQVSLPYIRQLFTQVAYTRTCLSILTRILFHLEWVSIFQADLTGCYCWIISSIWMQHNRNYRPFSVIPHYQYPDANQF